MKRLIVTCKLESVVDILFELQQPWLHLTFRCFSHSKSCNGVPIRALPLLLPFSSSSCTVNLCNFPPSIIKIVFIFYLIGKVADIHVGKIVVGQPQGSCCSSHFPPKVT